MLSDINMQPIKVYSYLRVSTSMQVDAYSLDAQRNVIKKYAYSRDMILVREYGDFGISGKNIDDRVDFKKMLNDIATNKDDVKYVLVYKLSRFGRNAADVLSSLQIMQDYGVNLICVEDGIDSSKDSGKLIISVLSAVAEIERENIRVQTMAGRKQKALSGKWNGGFAPYGYRLENGELFIQEDEAPIIEKIFDMYVNEDFGIVGIAKRLNALGIKKKVRHNGKKDVFSARFITLVIDNPIYKGYIAFGRRKTEKIDGKRNQYHIVKETDESNITIVKGKHMAIIPEELWDKAHQKRIAMGGKKEKLEPDHHYILSGLISCPYCGKHMYGVPSRKRKKDGELSVSYAYACRQVSNGTGNSCPRPKQYNCKDIDEQVAKIVIWQLNRTEILEEMAKQARREFDVSDLQKRIDECAEKIKGLEIKKKALDGKIKELDPLSETFERMLDSFTNNLEETISEILEYEKIIKEDETKIKNAKQREEQWNDSFSFMLRLFSEYDNYSDYEKKKLMQKLVKNIEIYPDKREFGYLKSIEFAFPIFKSRLSDERDTVFTIQDNYPDILDEDGRFNGYDPSDEYIMQEPEIGEDGCVVVYPDESDYFEENGCLPPEHLRSKISLEAEKFLMEQQEKIPPKETTDETVVLLIR